MIEAIALIVVIVVAAALMEAALALLVVLAIYGPAACTAIVAGWYAMQLGASLPIAFGVALLTGLAVRVVTIRLLRILIQGWHHVASPA